MCRKSKAGFEILPKRRRKKGQDLLKKALTFFKKH